MEYFVRENFRIGQGNFREMILLEDTLEKTRGVLIYDFDGGLCSDVFLKRRHLEGSRRLCIDAFWGEKVKGNSDKLYLGKVFLSE